MRFGVEFMINFVGTYYTMEIEPNFEKNYMKLRLMKKSQNVAEVSIEKKEDLSAKIHVLLRNQDVLSPEQILLHYGPILEEQISSYLFQLSYITDLRKRIISLEKKIDEMTEARTIEKTAIQAINPPMEIEISYNESFSKDEIITSTENTNKLFTNVQKTNGLSSKIIKNYILPKEIELQIKKASALKSEGKISDSINLLESIISQTKDVPQALNLLASLYIKKRDYIRALDLYKQANSYQKDDKDSLLGMAEVYRMTRRSQLALDILEKANVIFPNDKDIFMSFGLIHEALGESDLALDYFDKASKISKKEEQNYSKINRIEPENEDNKIKKENINENRPNNSNDPQEDSYDELINMGTNAYRRNDYQLAFDCFERAISKEPENPRAFHNIGVIAEKINNKEKAIQAYEKAKTLYAKHNDEEKIRQYNEWITKLLN